MNPIEFPEQTKVLNKPDSMTDAECSSMAVHCDGKTCISCWKGGLWDRVKFLFTGKMWLYVLSGQTQPPVCITPHYPFVKNKE